MLQGHCLDAEPAAQDKQAVSALQHKAEHATGALIQILLSQKEDCMLGMGVQRQS